MTAKAAFKQSNVTRALKAAVAAGTPPRALVVNPDGSFRLDFTDTPSNNSVNPLDRILPR